jgi:hypothetical protein
MEVSKSSQTVNQRDQTQHLRFKVLFGITEPQGSVELSDQITKLGKSERLEPTRGMQIPSVPT